MITVIHTKPNVFVLNLKNNSRFDNVTDRVFDYTAGKIRPNYPMPAIRMRTFDSLVKLGYTSAENNFDIDTVFEYYIKD